MLRKADAAFFARDMETASRSYTLLRERLSFVPSLIKNGAGTRLLAAFERLEHEGLSWWTLDILQLMYREVCARLAQIELGNDLFGLEKDWVPRLSYSYYSGYARQQLQHLKVYETSYWAFWDANQRQMDSIFALHEASAVNVYRNRDADERLKSALARITEKEKTITAAAEALKPLKADLLKDLATVKKDLDGLEWPSIGSIATILDGIVLCVATTGAASFIAGAGAVAGGVAAIDEVFTTIKDDTGQRINKDLLLKQVDQTKGDLDSLLSSPAYTTNADGTRVINSSDSTKLAVTQQQLETVMKQFCNKLGDSPKLKVSLKAFVDASNNRNQDIIAYNDVLDVYLQIKNQAMFKQQAQEIGSRLIRKATGLPAIVFYYQRIRDENRVSILRTIRHSALALRFWGLRDVAKFDSPHLLSNVDQIEAHLDVLLHEFESIASRFSSYTSSVHQRGIRYRLTKKELDGLKVPMSDPWTPELMVHSVNVSGLETPARLTSFIQANPFAGRSNIRLSSVRCWIPGLKVVDAAKKGDKGSRKNSNSNPGCLQVELIHTSLETIVDPDDNVWTFHHHPLHISVEYDWRPLSLTGKGAVSVHDLDMEKVMISTHSMPLDGQEIVGNNLQAPVGPFAKWRVTVRESVNGELDWTGVSEAYLEFTGSHLPFRR